MPPSTVTFLDALRDSRLLDAAQRDELTRHLQERFADPRSLAKELLQRGWLTVFQVNQLFQGHGSELTLGPYILLERIGEGGTGQVFRARHGLMNRIVALKLIRKELLADGEVVQRFYREVRVISQLSHPNVVHAYDAGPIPYGHFLVMEFFAGTTLSQLVKRDGPVTVERACDYVRQAAAGLQHIHERGLIHRDVKPSNLLVTRINGKEVVKILDLGLARLGRIDDGELTSTLTPVGAVTMGTPDYLAPEQALDFHQVDIRADIYSLGCTFYSLLTAQPPFPGGSMAQKLLRHQQTPPPPIERFRGDLPPTLGVVVHRMLAKKPEERYQIPLEVVDAIDAVISRTRFAVVVPGLDDPTLPTAMPVPPLVPIEVPDGPPILRPRQQRRRLAIAVGGVLFLGLAALVLGRWFSSSDAREKPVAALSPSAPATNQPEYRSLPRSNALRDLIRPDPKEMAWSQISWSTQLLAARRGANTAGKPLFLWDTDGHPLGGSATDGIAFRSLALADPEISQLIREDFVAAATDDWYQRRRQDSEGQFFRALANQRNPRPRSDGNHAGLYCLTADGTLLAFRSSTTNLEHVRAFLRQGLAEWKKLPEARRQRGAAQIGRGTILDGKYYRALPRGGCVVNVYTRILEKDGRGEWRRGTTAVPGADHAGLDRVWLTAAECQEALSGAGGLSPGAQFPLPGRLAERIARYHLVDNTRGEPVFWRREDVRRLQISLTIARVTEKEVQLTLEGKALLATQADLNRAERGYDARLTGDLVYDLNRKTWSRFDVVAIGEHWGEGPFCPGARPGRTSLGIVLELVSGRSVDVPPAAARDWEDYLAP